MSVTKYDLLENCGNKTVTNSEIKEYVESLKKRHIINLNSVIDILKKFRVKKDGIKIISPELAFRRAAALGRLEIMKELIREVKDLDIFEKGSESLKTALDFAKEYNQDSIIKFLNTLSTKKIIKEISENQIISLKNTDLEISGDVTKNVIINIEDGDLIIRGSVKDNVKISVTRKPLVDIQYNDGRLIIGYALNHPKKGVGFHSRITMIGNVKKLNESYFNIGGKVFWTPIPEEKPLLKANLTIIGTISDLAEINADGSATVNFKNFFCKKSEGQFIDDPEGTVSYLLNDNNAYENIIFFKQLIESFKNTISLEDSMNPFILAAVKNNKLNYLRILINRNFDANFYHKFIGSDQALTLAIEKENVQCTELLLTVKDILPDTSVLLNLIKRNIKQLSEVQKNLLSFIYFSIAEDEFLNKIYKVFPNQDMPKHLVGNIVTFLTQKNERLNDRLIEIGKFDQIEDIGRACFQEDTDDIFINTPTITFQQSLHAKTQEKRICSSVALNIKTSFYELCKNEETSDNIEKMKKIIDEGLLEIEFHPDSSLMQAAEHGKLQYCKLLIKNGANVNYVNDFGETALTLALQKGNINCVELLLKANAKLKINHARSKPIKDYALNGNCLNAFMTLLSELKLDTPQEGSRYIKKN